MRKCIVAKLNLSKICFSKTFLLCSEPSWFSKALEFVHSCWIAQIPTECRSRIRSPRVGLPRSRQSAGRECGAFVTDCPDPNKVPVTNSGPACRIAQIPAKCRSRTRGLLVKLLRLLQNAGRYFESHVSDCPDSKKCHPRFRSHRVGLRRSRQSAGRAFGDVVTACPGPDKVPVANSRPSCRIGQMPKRMTVAN